MNIFITGIAGFLGSHIADKMIDMNHAVSGVDNLIGGYESNIPDKCKYTKMDMNNLELLYKCMSGSDIVYHTACTAYEGLSVFSPSLVVQNTVQISVNAMVAAIRSGVKRFVYCSSMARYGTQEITPFTEDMIPRPQDPYGIAKLSAEQILKNLSAIHDVELVIAVPHNIVGPRQKYDDPYRNVVSIMVNLMLQNRQPIIYGDGSQIRCFSDIEDDVDCLVKMAFLPNVKGEIINIGPDENEITILELAQMIANKLRFNLNPIMMKDRPMEVKHATCSANKARKLLGYNTKKTLSQSLDGIIEFIKKNGVADFKYHLPIELINEKTPDTWKRKLF